MKFSMLVGGKWQLDMALSEALRQEAMEEAARL
jgi:hypothetical protein